MYIAKRFSPPKIIQLQSLDTNYSRIMEPELQMIIYKHGLKDTKLRMLSGNWQENYFAIAYFQNHNSTSIEVVAVFHIEKQHSFPIQRTIMNALKNINNKIYEIIS